MFFAMLVLLSAFLIEGIGTYVSVVGLSSLFAANPVIIVLAVALDVGKVVSVSFLYKYWKKINFLMKLYMTIAAMVLMIITSAGAFGYLSGQFQKAISGTNESSVVITALTEEQGRLQKRKEEIDKQISKLPDNMVRGRKDLIKQFGPEVDRINTRLVAIDTELPKLKVETLKKNVEVGPIIYIAEAFNTTPEAAVKWVILTIIFVFDPLAIALLLSGNFLIEKRESEKEEFIPPSEPKVIFPTPPDANPVEEEEDVFVPFTELPKKVAEPFTNGYIQPTYAKGPHFIPSPTQAITSWTTSTTEELAPVAEEPIEQSFPELNEQHEEHEVSPEESAEVDESPAEVIPAITEEELQELDALIEAAPPLEELDESNRQIDDSMIPGASFDVDELAQEVANIEKVAVEIEQALAQHDEREVIRLNSLMKPTKPAATSAVPRSQLEDVPLGADVMIDENRRRASGMHRNKYNDSTITVGGPSDRL